MKRFRTNMVCGYWSGCATNRRNQDPTITYHKQLAQTMAQLLGFDFKVNAGHEVGDVIKTVIK